MFHLEILKVQNDNVIHNRIVLYYTNKYDYHKKIMLIMT